MLYDEEMSPPGAYAKMLQECATKSSKAAVDAAFAHGLSITVARNGYLVRVSPEGIETRLRPLK